MPASVSSRHYPDSLSHRTRCRECITSRFKGCGTVSHSYLCRLSAFLRSCLQSRIKCPSWTWLSCGRANSLRKSPSGWRSAPYRTFLRYFGMNTKWYWRSPRGMFLGFHRRSSKVSFPCNFERFTGLQTFLFHPVAVKLL